MKFVLDAEQRLFAETLRRRLAAADLPKTIRSWASGAPDAGRALWSALAEAGVFALAVPAESGGAGPLPVELVTAFVELGRAGAPGPLVETVAAAELLGLLPAGGLPDGPDLPDVPDVPDLLGRIAAGEALVTLAFAPDVPYALDADTADVRLLLAGSSVRTAAAGPAVRHSLDPARRLFSLDPEGEPVTGVGPAVAAARDLGVLACAAQLAGVGRALLEITVEYARTRQQFGHPIGEFQAIKHHLANALVDLEYATPLLYGAALSYGTPDFSRDASAAKVAASEAAYATARTALQVHGAIGYTDEYDPSLLIRKARALHSAWGSPDAHRMRVLAALP